MPKHKSEFLLGVWGGWGRLPEIQRTLGTPFSTELLSRLSSHLAVQNQETMDLNVGPASNGDMVATAVVKFSLKFESLDPLRGFQRNC